MFGYKDELAALIGGTVALLEAQVVARWAQAHGRSGARVLTIGAGGEAVKRAFEVDPSSKDVGGGPRGSNRIGEPLRRDQGPDAYICIFLPERSEKQRERAGSNEKQWETIYNR